ncbi:MAG: M23 family metallopeptidase [Thermoleophilia bacterium]|nr:M23 family metallopeptidase [Thermoleophilia bacterium]
MDIAVPEGGSVRASASGVVIFAGYTPAEGGGTTVSIEHQGGIRTTYLHIGQLNVSEGQLVAQGQDIGTSDGSPLHFGIKVASPREFYFDPGAYLPPAAVTVTQQENSAVTADTTVAAAVSETLPAIIVTSASLPEASLPSAESAADVPASVNIASAAGSSLANPGNLPVELSGHTSREPVGLGRFSSNPAVAPEISGLFNLLSAGAISSIGKSGDIARLPKQHSNIPGGHSAARNVLICAFLLLTTSGIVRFGNLAGFKPAPAR